MKREEELKNITRRIQAETVLEEVNEWRKWMYEIPFIEIPNEYVVQLIPPFTGAIVRMRVAHKEDLKNSVSIYLDCYNRLGIYGDEYGLLPYWELYPYIDGDVFRCGINDVDLLKDAIIDSIEKIRSK
jgi:hypothetical protein